MVQQVLPERRSAIDSVLKGLQVASAAYGLKSEYEQNKLRQKQMELAQSEEERAKKRDELTGLDITQRKRNVWLAQEGIIPQQDFNDKYYKVDDTKLEKFMQQYKDFPWQPIKMRVESPESETGFVEVTSIPKEDLKAAQQMHIQTEQLIAEQDRNRLLSGGKTQPKPTPTAGTFSAAGFAERVGMANQAFDDLEDTGFNRSSLGTSLLSALAEPAGEFGEGCKSDELKMWEQSTRNFVNAILRRESGAAISPSEFENASKQYFPMWGDSGLVKEQKRRNRLLVQSALTREAQFGLTGEIQPLLHSAQMSITGVSQPFKNTLRDTSILPKAMATQQQPQNDVDFLNQYVGGR